MELRFIRFLKENFDIKVFAIFTIFVFVISSAFTAFFIQSQSRTLTDEMIKDGKLLARVLAHNARIGVFSENEALLKDPVESVFQEPGVLEISILNAQGQMQTKREANETKAEKSDLKHEEISNAFEKFSQSGAPFYVESKDIIEFWAPVVSGSGYSGEEDLFFGEDPLQRNDRLIGLVRITTDKKMLRGQIEELLTQSLLIGLFLLIAGAAVTYILAKRISDPLKKLNQGVKALGMGGVVEKVPVETRDEIGTLAESFNIMSESLQARKKALEESEEKYRTILGSIEEGYYECDFSARITFANEALLKMLGYPKQEIIDQEVYHFLDQQNRVEAFEVLKKVRKTGEPVKSVDLDLTGKDGGNIQTETSVSLMLDEKGEPVGFRGMFRDVTERRRAEEEKARLTAQLQQAQKLEAIGTLAGGVAHDLNNVLAGLIGYPELLLMELPNDSPLRDSISTIKKSGEKASAIVQDLLTLARRGVSVEVVMNLNDIISDYLKSPEYQKLKYYHPQVQTEVHLGTNLLNIMGSPIHISKMVMNLVSNAAEAMASGGKLTISTQNQYIDRPVRGYEDVQEGEYVLLTVSDTGVGISLKDRDRIFEPFYSKKVMGRSGTGLGMAVVWGTVKDHKGYIDLQSIEGSGTQFIIYLPATRQGPTQDKLPRHFEDYKGKGESILVVDDVPEQREIASRILGKLGYSVITTESGEDAVEYMKHHSCDLLVSDMIMDPGIDGLETYRQICELHPGQKAIIVSGFSESNKVREAQRLGVGSFVKKPYLLETIGIAVRAELDK